MTATTTVPAPQDRLDIVDALYRMGAGIDFNDSTLLHSTFTEDAVLDFGPAARSAGVDFPLLEGRDAIVGALTTTVGLLDTTHTVTNPRITVEEAGAKMYALVEAMHLLPGHHERFFLMKNRYDVDLRREDGVWRIARFTVTNAWWQGEPKVLLGG